MSAWRSAAFAALAFGALAGCKEQISSPGKCPALCPSGHVQLADTLLTTADVSDTSVRGFVLVREASYLLASNLDSLQSLVLVRFSRIDTTWFVTLSSGLVDTAYVGNPDSVVLDLHLVQRDTAVKGLKLLVYRLPALFDTGASYASILPYFADSTLVDTVPISDTLQTGDLPVRIADSLVIAPADTGVVSLGIAVVAAGKTALALGSGNLGTTAPILSTYIHAKAPLDTLSHVTSVEPSVSLFVMNPPPGQPPTGVLALGGIPTARATLRLSLPTVVVDSNAVVRATLLLNTTGPAGGFARDSFFVFAQPVVRDFGAKSILWPDSTVSGSVLIHEGQTGPVALDLAPILRFWGTTQGDSTPRLIVLRAYPEGSILGSVTFAGRVAGALGPQLRVTYVKPYTFGLP
ncbi:MAG TPA: hypothetical protein VEH62_05035 [Gemmatimonadales bacterium]|nr:hypothetical protein [Gemmatimonadales bacterium]